MAEPEKTRAEQYKTIAIILGVVGGVAFLVSLIFYGIMLGVHFEKPLSEFSADWGTFGDFVGGIAGTVIALATLIALVYTLHLQAKELESTSEALKKQAAATERQVKDLQTYEEQRIQPILKAEWQKPEKRDELQWIIRNVGLGPCILDSIELLVKGQSVGSHNFKDASQFYDLWEVAITDVLQDSDKTRGRVVFDSFHSLKRALAPDEPQRLLRVKLFMHETHDEALALLDGQLEPVIRFRSLAGVHLTTQNQYDDIIGESSAPHHHSASRTESNRPS